MKIRTSALPDMRSSRGRTGVMIRLMPPRVIVSHLRALASLDFRKLVQSVAIVAEIPHPGHNPGRSPRSPYCSNCAANREFSPVGKETMIASVAANNNPEQFRLSITRPRLNAPSSVSLSLSLSLCLLGEISISAIDWIEKLRRGGKISNPSRRGKVLGEFRGRFRSKRRLNAREFRDARTLLIRSRWLTGLCPACMN